MNYASLVTEIQSYTENEFVTTDINTFITQAEQRIYNGVQLAYLRKNTTGTLTSGNKYLSLTPDSGYTMELHYYYYPESITTVSSGTTWVGDNFSSVLLYGSILEAYTFMKGEPDVIALCQKRYDEALVMLKELAEYKNRNDTYRGNRRRIASV
jgi:hypothetical protein